MVKDSDKPDGARADAGPQSSEDRTTDSGPRDPNVSEIRTLLFEDNDTEKHQEAYDKFVRLVESGTPLVNGVGIAVRNRLENPEDRTVAVSHLTMMVPVAPEAFEVVIPTLSEIAADETAPQRANATRVLFQFATAGTRLDDRTFDVLTDIVESGAPEPRKFAVYTLETVSQERPDRVVNAVPRLLSFIEESASTPDMGDFLAQDDDVPGSDVPMAAENAVREQRLDTADVRAAAGETVARVAEERPHEVSLGSASLEVLLTDDSPAVLRAGTRICDALAGRQPECVFDVLPALVDRLGPKESDETRSSASEAVRTLCEHDRAEVRSVLHDRSDPAFASLRSGPPASLDACRVLRAVLARETQMTDADVSHRSLVDRLGELLADDDPAVRASAALATGQLEVSEDIVELLDPAPSEADATESNERAGKRASGEPKDAVAGSSEG
jgi:hypothetical protein